MAFDDGASLTADYQFVVSDNEAVLGSYLYGGGANNVWFDGAKADSLTGLFDVPETKSQDVSIQGGHGAYANPDYMQVRQIHIPIVLRNLPDDSDPQGALVNAIVSLAAVWVPRTTDLQLAFQWPGIGKFWYFGRPRGMTVDLSVQPRGAIRALLRFDCLDPERSGPD